MSYNFLIVDDSSIIRKVIQKTLGLAGIDVGSIYEAANGREGLDVLEKEWVDLVFLDINMPVMNGLEFMEHLRNNPQTIQTPVVVVSTEGSRERRATLAEKDIKAYLRKPVTPEEISKTIQQILGGTV
jgi:two-component system, chemotaxis family, chemotaxis protein CheY